jgi:tetratricopeptide (TPR) repeat protein
MLDLVAEARRHADPVVLADALSLAHHCLLGPEHASTRLSLAEELLALGTTVGRPIDTLMGVLWRTVDLFLVGDPHAGRSMNELRGLAHRTGHAAVEFVVSAMEVMLVIRSGRLPEAEDVATICRDRGLEVGDADALGWYGAHLVAIRCFQGRASELVPMLADVAYSPTLAETADPYFTALAVAAADAGNRAEAAGALRRLRRGGLHELRSSSTWLLSLFGAAEAAFLLGDADIAREAYELMLPYADFPVMASLAVACFGSTHYPLGVAALTTGNLDRAAEHLTAAVQANEALGNWPAHRHATCRLTTVLEQRETLESANRTRGLIVCQHLGRRWTITHGPHSATVEDSVGMRYIAVLLTNPGLEVAAADLAGRSVTAMTAQPILDEPAKRAYRRRVEDLRAEIERSEDSGDLARAAGARKEYEQLLAELQLATGLGGRVREFADIDERARTAVQKAIRRAVSRVKSVDTAIGRELDDTIVTGVRCCYIPQPDQS